ncbi:MAG: YolD-like family protein [Clostridia bacterium]|nr:YolD-like family protein [Clostridia bacterium]
MANKPKSPMPISERAKQFLPFAAVKGLTEALEKKEKVALSKTEISEDLAAELNEKIHKVKKASIVTITYFYNDDFIELTGAVDQIDSAYRTIQIGDNFIDMDDILGINIVEEM